MTWKLVLAFIGMSLCVAAQATDRAQVRFVHPEKFTDAGRYWGGEASRDFNLGALARHIERRAAQLVPEGERLTVTVSNVDLAGGYEPWRRGLGDVRVVRDVYPPAIDLTFQLIAANGSIVKEGERRLRNLAFQVSAAVYRDDPLRYEKALIDDWMERDLSHAR